MSLIVQKYGGTSVGDPFCIRNIAKRLVEMQNLGHNIVVVVSAMSGVTDSLLLLANKVADSPSNREIDVLLSTGEQTTIALMAMAIIHYGGRAISLTGAQAGIITSSTHTKAKIYSMNVADITKYLYQEKSIVIVAGFQGKTMSGDLTTLGRGGSDLTAIALASVLNADQCQIFTDVDGVYTADPHLVPKAQKIEIISYDEMLEMASSGSKVMQARSVEFAKKFGVVFEVRNSFNNNGGTIVKEESLGMENVVVRGVSIEKNQAKITLNKVPDTPGYAAKLFSDLTQSDVNIDIIIQNISTDGYTDISFTMHASEVKKISGLLDQISKNIGAGGVKIQDNIAKLSVIGIGMRSHSGVAAKLFTALADGDINIQMISTSEIKIAVIIDEKHIVRATQLVHSAFGLDND